MYVKIDFLLNSLAMMTNLLYNIHFLYYINDKSIA
jgi:hypothetical protein